MGPGRARARAASRSGAISNSDTLGSLLREYLEEIYQRESPKLGAGDRGEFRERIEALLGELESDPSGLARSLEAHRKASEIRGPFDHDGLSVTLGDLDSPGDPSSSLFLFFAGALRTGGSPLRVRSSAAQETLALAAGALVDRLLGLEAAALASAGGDAPGAPRPRSLEIAREIAMIGLETARPRSSR